jgi:hypothetical protein
MKRLVAQVVRRRAARKRVPTVGNTSPRGLSCVGGLINEYHRAA